MRAINRNIRWHNLVSPLYSRDISAIKETATNFEPVPSPTPTQTPTVTYIDPKIAETSSGTDEILIDSSMPRPAENLDVNKNTANKIGPNDETQIFIAGAVATIGILALIL